MPVAVLAEKRNFRCMMSLSPSFVVIPGQFYQDNLLRNPAGVRLDAWKGTLSEMLGDFDTRFATRSQLYERLDEVYADYGFTGEPDKSSPNIRTLHRRICEVKYPLMSHESRYSETLKNRVSGIMRHSGNVFLCDYGIDIRKLLSVNFALEMDSFSSEIQSLILKTLMARILLHYIEIGDRTSRLKTLIVVDEAQHLLRRQEELRDSPSKLSQLIALAREYGCGLVAGAQNIRDLSYSLTSNTAHKIGTGFADMRDLDEFCRTMG